MLLKQYKEQNICNMKKYNQGALSIAEGVCSVHD